MNNPRVEVIIPTYNRPDLVLRAIKSVLNQTYENFGLIVFDNSPNDDTEQLILELKNKEKIHYIHERNRMSLPKARNISISLLSKNTDYFAFLDDDDEFLPNFLKTTIQILEQNNNVDVVMTSVYLYRQDGFFIKKYLCKKVNFWETAIGNGSVMRKDAFDNAKIFWDEKTQCLGEDLDFGVRFLQNHKWICIEECLRNYYGYPVEKGKSMSTAFSKKTSDLEIEYFLNKNFNIYKKAGRSAISWLYFLYGKVFMRSGKYKKGIHYLFKSVFYFPNLRSAFYLFIALLFPFMFQQMNVIIFKHKVLNILRK